MKICSFACPEDYYKYCYIMSMFLFPLSAIQLAAAATQDSGIQGLQTLTMANTGGGTAASAIVQYTQGQDGQFFVPGTLSLQFG